MAVSGVAACKGGRPMAIFNHHGHPTPYASDDDVINNEINTHTQSRHFSVDHFDKKDVEKVCH
jgi:hypothetical protein